jgi:hypothetical protein
VGLRSGRVLELSWNVFILVLVIHRLLDRPALLELEMQAMDLLGFFTVGVDVHGASCFFVLKLYTRHWYIFNDIRHSGSLLLFMQPFLGRGHRFGGLLKLAKFDTQQLVEINYRCGS